MNDATWYLGPLGDMRELVVPEPGISINEVRYGGVHQGLSGARTMDVTGHRKEYAFEFRHLEQDEYAWYEALHTRLIPGPHHLLDPLKRNRLSGQASRMQTTESRNNGVYLPGDPLVSYVRDWPSEVLIPGRSMRIAGWEGTNAFLQFDNRKRVPLLDNETLTASIYLRSDSPYSNAWLRVSWYDENEVFVSNSDIPINISTTWTRHWFTYHEAPRNARGATMTLVLGSSTTAVYAAAPQLEADAMWPSPWELGGGSAVVLIDQLPAVSNRFPLRDASLTLLEA